MAHRLSKTFRRLGDIDLGVRSDTISTSASFLHGMHRRALGNPGPPLRSGEEWRNGAPVQARYQTKRGARSDGLRDPRGIEYHAKHQPGAHGGSSGRVAAGHARDRSNRASLSGPAGKQAQGQEKSLRGGGRRAGAFIARGRGRRGLQEAWQEATVGIELGSCMHPSLPLASRTRNLVWVLEAMVDFWEGWEGIRNGMEWRAGPLGVGWGRWGRGVVGCGRGVRGF